MLAQMERMRARLRPLLAERFQLVVQKDTKELPVYELLVGKSGHKMKPADETVPPHMRNGRGEMMARAVPMQLLVDSLSSQVGRTVVDRTGLQGRFEFELHWTPDPGMGPGLPGVPGGPGGPGGPPSAPADLSGPSLFTAIQEQLGLKLEPGRAPVPAIVVVRAEKPSEN
jgi:uncharacterized protein (TIGR03435 family)